MNNLNHFIFWPINEIEEMNLVTSLYEYIFLYPKVNKDGSFTNIITLYKVLANENKF